MKNKNKLYLDVLKFLDENGGESLYTDIQLVKTRAQVSRNKNIRTDFCSCQSYRIEGLGSRLRGNDKKKMRTRTNPPDTPLRLHRPKCLQKSHSGIFLRTRPD